MAVTGSLVPFTSPMLKPVRAAAGGVDWLQPVASAPAYATAGLIAWLAGMIYGTAIF